MARQQATARQKSEKTLEEKPYSLGFLVHDVSRMRRTAFDQAVKPLDLTRSQWWVLAQLSRHPDDQMKQTDLARALDVGKVTVGGLIDRLEASGHVERRADPDDRRSKRIVVTAKGHQAIEDMKTVVSQLNEIVFAGIPPHHLRMAEDVLHLIKVNLREHLGSSADGAGDAG